MVTVVNKTKNKLWYRFYQKETQNFCSGSDISENQTNSHEFSEGYVDFKLHIYNENCSNTTFDPKISTRLNEDFSTHRVDLVNVFGPRPSSTIKVFMACLAGPADPLKRTDIGFIDDFYKIGVPYENIHMLLETQCTPKVILANLENLVSNCQNGDVLVCYLGGHGNRQKRLSIDPLLCLKASSYYEYNLCTYKGCTISTDVFKVLKGCPAEIYLIIDSCYSGQMIEDYLNYHEDLKLNIQFLSSTLCDLSAWTGWLLVDMLRSRIFDQSKNTSFNEVCLDIVQNFKTSSEEQKAVYNFSRPNTKSEVDDIFD